MFKNIYRSGSNILTRAITNPVSKDSLQTHNLNFSLLANELIGKSLVDNNTLKTHQTSNSTPSYLPPTTFTRSMASGGVESSAKTHKYTNRLAQEKSPYLLQHAHNPVNWYPWGEEAIEKARRENKLIFLSVGYSTCHWCHVMERESFENEQVAELMNQHFVNIKVDREERPDIDRIYMQFVLMMLGSGGWPMSVWLTPDLAPITAGTYFPPQDRWGTPAFSTVLEVIANKWATKPDEMKLTGLKVIQVLKKAVKEKSSETAPHEADSCERQLLQLEHILRQRFDREYGGFGSHPKFPEVPRLNLLLHSYAVTKEDNILDMALHTLDCIGRGGIHDHVFGGFARYTVDRQWHVPHFEKMLYDQGQLMVAYSNAYKLTRNTEYLNYANGIFRYITTDLQHPLGGFYAGEDADSLPHAGDTTKIEGAFYAWSYNEVKQLIVTNKGKFVEFEKDVGDINKIFEIYSHHYDVKLGGNVLPSSDPHGHLANKNILIVLGSLQRTCEKFGVQKEKLEKILIIINDLLYNARRQRPRPHLDTKIICSWNGLVLSGISKLANSDSSQRGVYLKAAEKLKQFIYDNLYDRESQILKRACYGVTTNEATLLQNTQSEEIDGFLDDYAFLIRGLLDYYEATCDESSLQWAKDLQDIQNSLFWDNEQFGYYYSQADCPNVVMRLKDEQDGAEPCGNSVTARNLIMLSYYYEEDSYSIKLKQLFEYYADQKPLGIILPEMLSALLLHDNDFDVVAVLDPQHELSEHILMLCRQYFIPGLILQWQRANEPFKGGNKTKHMVNGQPSVYICHQHVCQLPITDAVELTERLDEYFLRKSSAEEKKQH